MPSLLATKLQTACIMSTFGQNLKHLRAKKGLTQHQLAEKTGLTRSVISSYEEGRADPRLKTLQFLSQYFGNTIDDLVSVNLADPTTKPSDLRGAEIRVLTVPVESSSGDEMIPCVPVRAVAGYTRGFGDSDFVASLPKIHLPLPEISRDKTYRIFQAEGESMLPVPDKAYLICEYIQDWRMIRNDTPCVIITTDEGVVFKRVLNNLAFDNTFLLKSDNTEFKPYSLPSDQMMEAWKAVGYVTFAMPDPYESMPGLTRIENAISGLAKEVKKLKRKV
jgi:transcriptional regulator with XRE-family HTH domain